MYLGEKDTVVDVGQLTKDRSAHGEQFFVVGQFMHGRFVRVRIGAADR